MMIGSLIAKPTNDHLVGYFPTFLLSLSVLTLQFNSSHAFFSGEGLVQDRAKARVGHIDSYFE